MADRPVLLMFHIRGPMNLAMDLLDDPPFVHEMMGFATHCMKIWWSDRARFLIKRLTPKRLFRFIGCPESKYDTAISISIKKLRELFINDIKFCFPSVIKHSSGR
jgi:hypothetical protein